VTGPPEPNPSGLGSGGPGGGEAVKAQGFGIHRHQATPRAGVVLCYRAILESSNGALAYHMALDDNPAQPGQPSKPRQDGRGLCYMKKK
jgi:hypothetical protein